MIDYSEMITQSETIIWNKWPEEKPPEFTEYLIAFIYSDMVGDGIMGERQDTTFADYWKRDDGLVQWDWDDARIECEDNILAWSPKPKGWLP